LVKTICDFCFFFFPFSLIIIYLLFVLEILGTAADKKEIFLKAYEQIPYFQRQMSVFAYQSFLWNQTVSLMLSNLRNQQVPLQEKRMMKNMRFRNEKGLCVPLFAIPSNYSNMKQWNFISMDIPLLSSRISLTNNNVQETKIDEKNLFLDWKKYALQVLREEQFNDTNDLNFPFRTPFFASSPRSLFMKVSNFEISSSKQEKDEFSRVLKFDLGRGSYATVVVDSLLSENRLS
jgi:tRNA(Glu) U13 pseudouridine synthase TruD